MLLTKAIHYVTVKNERLSQRYVVSKINDTKALVKYVTASEERTVEFKQSGGICSCTEWQQLKYPCRHAIKANQILGYKTNAQEWYAYAYSPIYMLSNYKKAYANPGIVPPTLIDLVQEFSLKEDEEDGVQRISPPRYKTTGRPQKKTKRKRAETADGRPVKIYKCGNCGSTEHNRKRCPTNFLPN